MCSNNSVLPVATGPTPAQTPTDAGSRYDNGRCNERVMPFLDGSIIYEYVHPSVHGYLERRRKVVARPMDADFAPQQHPVTRAHVPSFPDCTLQRCPSGLSPAATSRAVAVSVPTPSNATRSGAVSSPRGTRSNRSGYSHPPPELSRKGASSTRRERFNAPRSAAWQGDTEPTRLART